MRRYLPEHVRGLVTLAFYFGWRITSEILTLQWAQIDRTVGTIRLEPGTTKNMAGRTVA